MAKPAQVFAVLLVVCLLGTATWCAEADSFGMRLEPGARECLTEVVEAGGTLAFTFQVTDGGSFDVDVTMTATFNPPVLDIMQLSRLHYLDFAAGRRDASKTVVVNTWRRSTDGKQTYVAPSVQTSIHGLPAEVTVCFDNSFSTVSPKWIEFAFFKQDVLDIDPDAVNKVEAEMELKLYHYGSIMLNLSSDANAMRLANFADRKRNEDLSKLIAVGVTANIFIMLGMSLYQYNRLTRFIKHQRKARVRVSVK